MSDPPSGTLLSHKDYEVRVTAAFIVGVASIPLIYPLGVVLGPVGLWLSISAYRRIKGSGRRIATGDCRHRHQRFRLRSLRPGPLPRAAVVLDVWRLHPRRALASARRPKRNCR